MRPFQILLALICCLIALPANAQSLNAEVRVMVGNSQGSGTVFYLDTDDNAYVLTNYHVAGKKGSRAGIEFWTADGKLLNATPGIVVESRPDPDVAVVKLNADVLPGTPNYIPLAAAGTAVAKSTTLFSRGSPGGTWQSLFIGQCFESDRLRMSFYPRPGGGRSGSSMQRDGKIVGLLTWSSGKPSYEEHGTDGRGYRSGYGIAQQIDQVWSVVRGQVSISASPVPEHYTPLVFQLFPIATATGVVQASVQEPVDKQEPADEGFSMSEEDQAALLRRRGNQAPSEDSDGKLLPRLDREREFPVLRSFFRIVLIACLVVGVILATVYFLGKRYLKVFLLMLAIASPTAATAQDEMAEHARRWSEETVASGNNWGEYSKAVAAHKANGGSIVTIISIPGCAPCVKLKEQLKQLDSLGFFNESNTSHVDATQDPQLAAALNGAPPQSFPVLVLQVPFVDQDGVTKINRLVHAGTFPTQAEIEKRLEQNPLMAQSVADVQTLDAWISGAGVK